jgi:hypothetical protein
MCEWLLGGAECLSVQRAAYSEQGRSGVLAADCTEAVQHLRRRSS